MSNGHRAEMMHINSPIGSQDEKILFNYGFESRLPQGPRSYEGQRRAFGGVGQACRDAGEVGMTCTRGRKLRPWVASQGRAWA